jgi:hypothetical protein
MFFHDLKMALARKRKTMVRMMMQPALIKSRMKLYSGSGTVGAMSHFNTAKMREGFLDLCSIKVIAHADGCLGQ